MKTVLLLASLALSIISCQAVPAVECQWGPSYWCQSQETAAQCGQKAYCTSQVWKVQKSDVRLKSVQCDVCKLLVGYVDKFVEDNSTEAEAEAAVEKFCDALGSLKDECDTVVKQFFPQIWQMLMKELGPDTICTEIKLCTSRATVAKVQLSDVGSVECDVCKLVANLLDKYAKENKTAGEVQRDLEGFCKILGSLRDECDTLLSDYFPQLWNEIVNELNPTTVCSDLKLCTTQVVAQVQKQVVSPVKSTECDFCKIMAIYLNKFMASNGTEVEAKDEVKKLCSLLGSEAGQCNTVVDLFFDQIWKMVVDETEPDVICKLLKLCTNTSALKDAGLTCKDIGVCQSTRAKQDGRQLGMAAVPKQNLCDLCELVLSYVKPFVDSNSTKDEVKQALEQLCNIIPSNLKSECTSLVDQKFDAIWLLLESEIDNDLICKQIGLCNSSAVVALPKPAALKPVARQQSLCDICKLLVTFLKPYVDNNSTESEVEQALEQLCSILPSSLKSECTSVVDKNFGTIWLLLKSEFDNDLICKQIGLCNSSAVVALPKPAALKPAARQQSLCDICKLLVTFLKPYVDNNSTESEVEEQLDDLCNLVPGNYSKMCTNLLDEFFPDIWKMLQDQVDNDKICSELKLCNSSSRRTKPLASSGRLSGPACDVCILLSHFLKPFADNKTAENETVAAVTKLCTYLPTDYEKTCKNLTDHYIRDAWDEVQQGLDHNTLCTDFDICPSRRASTEELMADIVEGRVKDSGLCTICKLVSSFVREFVENNKTKAEAEASVAALCNKLPSPYNDSCSSLVDQYFDMIWTLIDSYVDDDDLCKQLKLCNSSSVVELKTEISGPLCIICEFVMKEVESMLDSNSTEAEIEAALDKVCSILPSSIKTDCDNFVNTYGKDIIKLLLDAVSPKLVCSALHLCLGAESTSVVVPVVQSVGLEDCSLCKTVLEFVKTLVKDYQKPIDQALDDVCDLMPSTIKGECADFVNEFGPAIIQLVDQEINPEQICKALKVCKESSLVAPWKKLARAKSY